MFTGIIEASGVITALTIDDQILRATVHAPAIAGALRLGESVATAGVCLTVTNADATSFDIDAMPATTNTTTVGQWEVGTRVNLERALRADGRFDGHIVQGHVDATTTVIDVRDEGQWRVIRFALPAEATGAVVTKGSICVDGVSLTVSAVSGPDAIDEWFEVSLIPRTLAVTTLGALAAGAAVNIETDILARHLERLLALSGRGR